MCCRWFGQCQAGHTMCSGWREKQAEGFGLYFEPADTGSGYLEHLEGLFGRHRVVYVSDVGVWLSRQVPGGTPTQETASWDAPVIREPWWILANITGLAGVRREMADSEVRFQGQPLDSKNLASGESS